MKLLTILMAASVLQVSSAQQNIFRYFGMCMRGRTCAQNRKPDAECCLFDNGRDLRDVKFCMTDDQKDGNWQGTYVDNDNTYWRWTCEKPPDKPDTKPDPKPDPEKDDKDPEKPDDKEPEKPKGTEGDLSNVPFLRYDNLNMEWIIWTIFLPANIPVLGWIVMIPVGIVYYLIYFPFTVWMDLLKVFGGQATFG